MLSGEFTLALGLSTSDAGRFPTWVSSCVDNPTHNLPNGLLMGFSDYLVKSLAKVRSHTGTVGVWRLSYSAVGTWPHPTCVASTNQEPLLSMMSSSALPAIS